MNKYKFQLLIITIFTIVITNSCNNNSRNCTLDNFVDSLNYSIGVKEMAFTRTEILKRTDSITDKEKQDVINGFYRMLNAKEKDNDISRSVYNGTYMGDNFSYIIKDDYLYGDTSIILKKDIVRQAITDAVHMIDWVKDSRVSYEWIKNKVFTPLTEAEIDTANYIAGFLNGHQIRNLILHNDTSKECLDTFCHYFFEAWDGSKYAFFEGLKAGKNFKNRYGKANFCFNDSTAPIDKDKIMKGFTDYYNNVSLLISEQEAEKLLKDYVMTKKSTFNDKIEKNKENIDSFFEENAKKENVFSTEDPNIQYEIHSKGKGIIPTENDTINAQIKISVKNINTFSDINKNDAPSKLPVDKMIPAWKKIFTTIPAGSEITIYNKHIEKLNDQDPLPPQSIVSYEIKVIDVIKKQNK